MENNLNFWVFTSRSVWASFHFKTNNIMYVFSLSLELDFILLGTIISFANWVFSQNFENTLLYFPSPVLLKTIWRGINFPSITRSSIGGKCTYRAIQNTNICKNFNFVVAFTQNYKNIRISRKNERTRNGWKNEEAQKWPGFDGVRTYLDFVKVGDDFFPPVPVSQDRIVRSIQTSWK